MTATNGRLLRFYMPYRVLISENFCVPAIEYVAIGSRVRPVPAEAQLPGVFIEFLSNVPDDAGHSHRVEVLEQKDDGTVIFHWLDAHGDDGLPVTITLEPLTLRVWRRMGEDGKIGGYEKLSKQITSEAALQNSFLSSFLDDGWVESTVALLGPIPE